jgi:Xaa-Pro dipeptidase
MALRHERALVVALEAGAEAVLAVQPSTVTWLTGFAPEIETGPNPFALPPMALLTPDNQPVLIISDDDEPAARGLGCELVTYQGYTIGPLRPLEHAQRALEHAINGRKVATEAGALPVMLALNLDWVDVGADLAQARALKDPDEIEKLRAAVALADVGQRAARQQARAGVSELEVWSALQATIEMAASGRIPLLADVLSGPRTEQVNGSPSNRVLQDGELLLVDLAPRYLGYWGGSCTTIGIGEISAETRVKYQRVHDALERAIEMVRPGVVVGELDELIRRELGYPHHTGHGLGTTYHEIPRIVPKVTTALEAGMVISLEPGIYGEGEGIRLGQIVLVTNEGCEVLSTYNLDL